MKNPHNKFENQIEQMRQEALSYVKRLVEQKFKQNKKLNSFVLAMGTFFWTNLEGKVLYKHEVKDAKISEFISEWDYVLGITGEGVKWFRDGTIITDW